MRVLVVLSLVAGCAGRTPPAEPTPVAAKEPRVSCEDWCAAEERTREERRANRPTLPALPPCPTGPPGTLRVRVTEETNGISVLLATVLTACATEDSDADGVATLSVPSGDATVRVVYGDAHRDLPVRITPGQTTDLAVSMPVVADIITIRDCRCHDDRGFPLDKKYRNP